MMIPSYSLAAILVDLLQPRTDRPLTEAEIESGALAEPPPAQHPDRPTFLSALLRHLPQRTANAS